MNHGEAKELESKLNTFKRLNDDLNELKSKIHGFSECNLLIDSGNIVWRVDRNGNKIGVGFRKDLEIKNFRDSICATLREQHETIKSSLEEL